MCAAHLVLLKPVVSFSHEWTVFLYKLVSKTKSNWFHGGLEWKHLSNPVILFKKKKRNFLSEGNYQAVSLSSILPRISQNTYFLGTSSFPCDLKEKKKQQRLKHQAVCLFNVSGTLPWWMRTWVSIIYRRAHGVSSSMSRKMFCDKMW